MKIIAAPNHAMARNVVELDIGEPIKQWRVLCRSGDAIHVLRGRRYDPATDRLVVLSGTGVPWPDYVDIMLELRMYGWWPA